MRRRLWIAVATIGLVLRLGLLLLAPRWGYPWDQFGNMGMGLAAERQGVLHVYALERDRLPTVRGVVVGPDGTEGTIEQPILTPPNYPPLSIVALWAQAWASSHLLAPLEVNTLGARLLGAIVPGLAELLIVWGVVLLVRTLGGRPSAVAGAAIVAWLFPPLAMNTWLWGQNDAFVLAPMVGAVVCMARGRWWLTGFFVAVASLVKPQGVLVAVPALFAAVLGGDWPVAARRVATVLASAALGVLALTAPWMATSGLAWFGRSYVASAARYSSSTLHAFNVWYLDALLHGRVLDGTEPMAAVSRDVWGTILFLLSGELAVLLCRRRRPAEATVLFAALWLWGAFLFPTRIHERYVLYCTPFVIALAAVRPRLWPSVVGLALVGVGEHTWNVWQGVPRPGVEWLLMATSLASWAWATLVAALTPGERA